MKPIDTVPLDSSDPLLGHLETLGRPELSAQRRQHIWREARQRAYQAPQKAPTFSFFRRLPLRSFVTACLVIILLLSSNIAVLAADSSLPGETLYPIKRGLESVQTTLTSEEARPLLNLHLLDRRVHEVVRLVALYRPVPPSLLEEITTRLDKTVTYPELWTQTDVLATLAAINAQLTVTARQHPETRELSLLASSSRALLTRAREAVGMSLPTDERFPDDAELPVNAPPTTIAAPLPTATPEEDDTLPSRVQRPTQTATPIVTVTFPPTLTATPPGQIPPTATSTPPPATTTPPPATATPPPDDGNNLPPGHGGTPPGQGGTPPGQGEVPPGQDETPPGQINPPPGQSKKD